MSSDSSSTPEPLRRGLRRRRATLASGGAIVVLAGAWALRPLPEIVIPPAATASAMPTEAPERGPGPLDRDAFAARLWVEPPAATSAGEAAAAAAQRQAAQAAIRWQLVGVTREGGRYVAALYDPEGDRLHLVRDGDALGAVTVKTISAAQVELLAAGRTVTLARERAR